MATTTITALTAANAANLTGAAVAPVDDSAAATVKATLAQLRTKMFAGSTGYTASDPVVCGTVNGQTITSAASFSGSVAIATTLAVTGTSALTGNVGIGAAAVVGTGLRVVGAITGTDTTQYGITSDVTVSAACSAGAYGVRSRIRTVAGLALDAYYGNFIETPILGGGGATILNGYGTYVLNQGAAGITNAYGVYISAQSGAATTNIGLYNAGTTTLVGAVTASATVTVTGGFGCNTKAAQTAYASGGALAAYGAGANGFDSGANASALHAMVVSIRAALVANGIMS